MKGIAVTLATREDAEAVSAIEKLTGVKFARADVAPTEDAVATEPKRRESKSTEKKSSEKGPARTKPAERPQPEAQALRDEQRERSPVVEDIQSDWNGPLPSFLSVGLS
jgi:hypothetical protein